jgi:hypothetical protein
MSPNIDLVVAERFGDALAWCEQNRLDTRYASSIDSAAIRIQRVRKPIVKVIGDPYESSLMDLASQVELAGGMLI